MRPLIAISAYWIGASWGPWTDYPAAMIPQGYCLGIEQAGGLPVIVPPIDAVIARPDEILGHVHGLICAGGSDVDPAIWGAEPHPTTDPPHVRRDQAEQALVREAKQLGLPYLGICRGAQILNVVHGGGLQQHLAEVVDMTPHRPRLGQFGHHPVHVTGGRLAEVYGDGADVMVHSHHHQGFEPVGQGLAVTATAPDGWPEGLEDPTQDFCVGVLWHPEEAFAEQGQPLFAALVDHARAYAARRT